MIQPTVYSDFYKTDHKRQYPKGTQYVYSNLTARESRIKGVDKIVVFGIQYFLKEYLINRFNKGFFEKPKAEVISKYQRRLDNALGKGSVSLEHMKALHDLGYLPIKIKALPEGNKCPLRVPCLTIVNTLPEFYWLTNFLETLLSNSLWQMITSATIADQYRMILDKFAEETSDAPEFVDFQGHDFSMRGMSSMESACMSGAAHLLSFRGTDTIPAIDFLEEYYGANSDEGLIGASVPATEHSVMCLGGDTNEIETFRRLITETYPTGIVSIVSDTWDYWTVLTKYLPDLKDIIMEREGKVVIRPDSGDPVKIICGLQVCPYPPIGNDDKRYDCRLGKDGKYYDIETDKEIPEHVVVGSIETLWKVFGGTVNSKGYKELDPHIGLIYGDSITRERCKTICSQLKAKGFASTNVVFGIGSYTYQHVTRDTFGFAVKATFGVVDGKDINIYKDPVTDNGVKKSAKGLLRVNSDYSLSEEVTREEEKQGLLKEVFCDGKLVNEQKYTTIVATLKATK